MNSNINNSGELDVSAEVSETRYVTSAYEREEGISSLAIVAAILALAILTCALFGAFSDDSTPVFLPLFGTTTTTTTLTPVQKPIDPTKTYPYATKTDKTQFVATKGGKGMYQMSIDSGFAILVRLSDMTTIAHKYADELIYPASMTKVLTIVTALDFIEDISDTYVITDRVLSAVPSGASVGWLSSYVGETVSVKDLLYGISYMSGADSVLCLVDYLDLTVSEFAYLMNLKAKEIGMKNSHFGGAIGMDSENNTSTCRDIAALMAYAMENPLCQELFGGLSYRLDYLGLTYYHSTLSKTLTEMGSNPDRVLGSKYTIVAAKSGLETKAGHCLVSYIRNDETDEYFVLVTAKVPWDKYHTKRNCILDMQEIFNAYKP